MARLLSLRRAAGDLGPRSTWWNSAAPSAAFATAWSRRPNGRYFFADYVAGRVYSIGVILDDHQDATVVDLLVLTDLLGGTAELGLISSFGVDGDGNMYIVSYSRGRSLKVVP